MIAFTYLKRLFSEWIFWVFTAIDLIGFYIGVTNPKLSIPDWAYWLIAGVGLVIANIVLFSQQQKKIDHYESGEANLRIILNETDTYFDHSLPPSQPPREHNDGLAPNGIPIMSHIDAQVEIENLGIEPGILEWEVDSEKSEIPDTFATVQGKENGGFWGHMTMEIPGRSRVKYIWNLELNSTLDDPNKFALALRSNLQFKIFLKYKTKRIGGFSKPSTILIAGDFSGYCEKILPIWQRWNLNNLAEILRPGLKHES